jgi:tetratricopeptide (TPR) repeat protein
MTTARFSLKVMTLAAVLLWAASALAAPAAGPAAQADQLLASPTLDFSQASQALALYEKAAAATPAPDPALLARLSRTCFILGQLAPQGQRMAYYEQGEKFADRLLQAQPQGVAGHYWLALNFCGQAEVGGRLKGMKLLPRIMEELKRSVALDQTYDNAGAHRVLGRIYYEAPGKPFSVGDINKSLQHLEAAVRLAPQISTNHLYLADALIRLNRTDQARQQLEQVLTSTRAAVVPQELEKDRQEARRELHQLKGSKINLGP